MTAFLLLLTVVTVGLFVFAARLFRYVREDDARSRREWEPNLAAFLAANRGGWEGSPNISNVFYGGQHVHHHAAPPAPVQRPVLPARLADDDESWGALGP